MTGKTTRQLLIELIDELDNLSEDMAEMQSKVDHDLRDLLIRVQKLEQK